MRIIIPFDATDPKTRLSAMLSPEERRSFSRASLLDVLDAIVRTGHEPTVLATDEIDVDTPVAVDDRPLTRAVNHQLATAAGPVAVIMADLPLATPESIRQLFSPSADVVLAPGTNGGTNAFVARHDEFRVDYHGASIHDHREVAKEIDASVIEIDSFRLAIDVDDRQDLVEVLLHGEGRAVRWLRDHGFELTVTTGKVTVERS